MPRANKIITCLVVELLGWRGEMSEKFRWFPGRRPFIIMPKCRRRSWM